MGRIALITGGTRGIGKAIAMEFAQKGYDIVVNYRTENDELAKFKKELEEHKVKTLFVQGDVTDFARWEEIGKEVTSKFGTIDVLVNNAGVTKDTLFLRMSEEDFNKVVDTNLKGTFNVTKQIIPYMSKQKSGKIINVSSVIGLIGNAGQSNYAASKAGLIGLTKSVARELASRNICCNAIAPGFIETDMTENIDAESPLMKAIPLGRVGHVEEVAELAAFLCSADYITGEVIRIDGGLAI